MKRERYSAEKIISMINVKTLLSNLLLIVIPFLLLELAFRALPVSYPPYILPVSKATPVARFQPNQHYVWSKGWNFSIKAKSYSNNYGYTNENDYDADASSPLLMVVGDSVVEAHQIDAGNSAAELLHSEVESDGRAYSIGLSGAPLSQYLVFAEYSKITFHPQAMVFIIVGNDFDESLFKYNGARRFHLFRETGEDLILERVDYSVSKAKALLRKSALMRYVMLNLEVRASLERFLYRAPAQPVEYIGNVPFTVDEERINDSMRVVDEFFDQLPLRSGLDATQILFVIDGMRPALYSEDELERAEDSYFAQMRRYFEGQALSLGYEVIDMQPIFIKRNKLDNSRFEFETDGHWNELGHSLAAKEIQNSAVFKSTFPRFSD